MVDFFSGYKNAPGEAFDNSVVNDLSCSGANTAYPNDQPPQAWISAVVGLDADLKARGEDRLPCWGGNLAIISHVRPNEHDTSSVAVRADRPGDLRSFFYNHTNRCVRKDGRCRGGKRRGSIRSAENT